MEIIHNVWNGKFGIFWMLRNSRLLLYLARYTYRVALEDQSITCINAEKHTVSFIWRDNRSHARIRSMTLPAFTFIARFLRHLLPFASSPARYHLSPFFRYPAAHPTVLPIPITALNSAPPRSLLPQPNT